MIAAERYGQHLTACNQSAFQDPSPLMFIVQQGGVGGWFFAHLIGFLPAAYRCVTAPLIFTLAFRRSGWDSSIFRIVGFHFFWIGLSPCRINSPSVFSVRFTIGFS